VNQFHLLGWASCGERESIFLLKFSFVKKVWLPKALGEARSSYIEFFFDSTNASSSSSDRFICQWENEIMGGVRGCDR
jgi:hypothetical protein